MWRFFKIAGIVVGVVALILVIGVFAILIRLPGPSEIRKSFRASTSRVAQGQKALNQAPSAPQAKPDAPAVPPASAPDTSAVGKDEPHTVKIENGEAAQHVFLDDFANPEHPMVRVCDRLKLVSQRRWESDPEIGSAAHMIQSLASGDENQWDPVVEASAAPIFRYMFRLPGMDALANVMKDHKAGDKDLGIVEKAKLYGGIVQAYTYMRAHEQEYKDMLQKTYAMRAVTKAVAANPELADDLSVRDFCQQLEAHLNSGEPTDAAALTEETSRFLAYHHVDPDSIGYDPNYRAAADAKVTKQSFTIQIPWLDEFFKRDIERIQASRIPAK